MTITVGIDTYVTVSEADEYISKFYVSTDERRIEWEALTEADKEVYLRQALSRIENLRFQGRKCNGNEQILSFPRSSTPLYPERRNFKNEYDYGFGFSYESSLLGYYDCDDVPQDIKNAQILEAFELAVPSDDTSDHEDYNGVLKSFSITGLSETYNISSSGDNSSIKTLIINKQAQQLLAKYVNGGYRIV